MLEEITQFKDSYSSSPSMLHHNLLNLYNHEFFLTFISNFLCFLVAGKLVKY